MGELHLEIYVERLKREFGIDCTVGNPKVSYRETVMDTIEISYLLKKQTGGQGQFAKIVGKLEATGNFGDVEFVDQTVGGNIFLFFYYYYYFYLIIYFYLFIFILFFFLLIFDNQIKKNRIYSTKLYPCNQERVLGNVSERTTHPKSNEGSQNGGDRRSIPSSG